MIKIQGDRDRGPCQQEGPPLLVGVLQEHSHNGDAVPDDHGDHHVRRGVEDLDQFARLFVGLGVQQVDEQERQAEIGRAQPDEPASLPRPEALDQQERNDGEDQVGEVELLFDASEIRADLVQRDAGSRLLVLTPGECMDEAVPHARITPVQRRVRNRRQWHVEVMGCTDPERNSRQQDDVQPGRDGTRQDRGPDGSDRREDADEVEDQQQGRIVGERPDLAARVQAEAKDPEGGVQQEEVAANPPIRHQHKDLQSHGGDDECLVIAEADAEQEARDVQVTSLMRKPGVFLEAEQHPHERPHGDGVHFDDDGLAPDVAVEAQQHAGHKTRHQRDPFVQGDVTVLEKVDGIQDQCRSTRNQHGHHAGGHGGREGRRNGHPPGNVREGQDLGEKPGVHCPDRVARRMRNTCVHRGNGEFPGVLQGHVRGNCQKVARHHDDADQHEGQPVYRSEQTAQRRRRLDLAADATSGDGTHLGDGGCAGWGARIGTRLCHGKIRFGCRSSSKGALGGVGGGKNRKVGHREAGDGKAVLRNQGGNARRPIATVGDNRCHRGGPGNRDGAKPHGSHHKADPDPWLSKAGGRRTFTGRLKNASAEGIRRRLGLPGWNLSVAHGVGQGKKLGSSVSFSWRRRRSIP